MTERSLLGAADSRRRESEPEDRLTEILAEVLRTSPLLTSWLVKKAFEDADEDVAVRCEYEVDAQVSLTGGGRPDVEIRFPAGGPEGRLFCESKIRAGWTEWQRRGYPAAPWPARFLVLSPGRKGFDDLDPSERQKFRSVRWKDLARATDRLGTSWNGRSWRSSAMDPDAPGQYRLLAELVSYLEREDVDVMIPGPITDDDLEVLQGVDDVVARWRQFRNLVLEEVQGRLGSNLYTKSWEKNWDPQNPKARKVAYSLTLRYGAGWEGAAWPALASALEEPRWSWQELILAPNAPWMNQDVPCVGIGIGLGKLPEWSDEMTEWAKLRDAIWAKEGAWLGPTNRNKIYRIVLARPLSSFTAGVETLDAQAEDAVTWALEALDDLVKLSGGDLWDGPA